MSEKNRTPRLSIPSWAATTGWLLLCLALAPHALGQEMRVETVSYKNGDLELRAFLYRPPGPGPYPAIVYNHGSEKNLAYIDRLAVPFVQQGYVFFAPNRRGHGRSPGTYILDVLGTLRGAEWSQALVRLHEEQLSDQLAGVAYLKNLPFVDSGRIGVYGWSFGGIQTLLAAERSESGYKAAVSCAGAAQTWPASPDLRTRLTEAAQKAAVPLFLLQAQNDHSLAAIEGLSEVLRRNGKPHQARVYPAFGATPQQGHEFCVQGSEIWGPEVFAFFAQHLR
ncbi:MAG: prolyl oligopeptidase family serine peptidase [Meiothermus sp.]|uniref:alpha/beta hydrolase family protein n=1 Tax=Meiothermus sp. TaxID=1955249 RepID=UPI00298EF8A7|nr:alpha/beta fold hydrolase [Meiothermus sp.]MDW8426860.1 prolyl oligopeptidase family serine peptidase [Meiothermus sp.]